MTGSTSGRRARRAVALAVAAALLTACGGGVTGQSTSTGVGTAAASPTSSAPIGVGTGGPTTAGPSGGPGATASRTTTGAPTTSATEQVPTSSPSTATAARTSTSSATTPTTGRTATRTTRPRTRTVTTAGPGPATSRPPAGPTPCGAAQVRPSVTEDDAGAGQRYATLTLRNTGSVRCTVTGYVGLQLLTRAGAAVPTRVVHAGGAARTVSLAPGGRARSQLHWSTVPGSGDPSADRCPPVPSRLRVTAPAGRGQDTVPWDLGAVCGGGRVDEEPLRPAG